MTSHPTPKELQLAWEEVKEFHKNHFKGYGVIIPNGDKYTYNICMALIIFAIVCV